jgi:undecaprenyl-diphosphatase
MVLHFVGRKLLTLSKTPCTIDIMSFIHVIILAIVQGLAELLPISSSAHVVVTEKLLGLDPSSPEMTLLLVMLHTGTMFAVIAYFWNSWRREYFPSAQQFFSFCARAAWATFLTAIVGYPIIKIIERTMFSGLPKAEIENLFGRLDLVAGALLAAGILIFIAGWKEARTSDPGRITEVSFQQAGWMGAVQGLCLPFRGFSRSGATISTGLLTGANRQVAERFSFALAVILTPPVLARELLRLLHTSNQSKLSDVIVSLRGEFMFALLGAVFSFLAGLLALKWLSSWLENEKWYLFGIYCLIASGAVFYLHHLGY